MLGLILNQLLPEWRQQAEAITGSLLGQGRPDVGRIQELRAKVHLIPGMDVDSELETAVHEAARQRQTEALELLLHWNGANPVHLVADTGQIESGKLPLNSGGDLTSTYNFGN